MNNKVSILIPVHNSEKFIAATIKSALNQTWQNIEIIIVDDGSTDNSYEIIKGFKSEIVKIYKQENKGACAARNLAFEKSTGDYIQYLDADDILHYKKIETQISLFNQFGNNIIVTGLWGRFYSTPDNAIWENQNINKDYYKPIYWLIDSWLGNGMAQTSVWLTPRHIIKKAGNWNEKLKINQDGEFFSRVLMLAEEIKFCIEAKVFYRSGNTNSISQSHKNKAKAESLLISYQLYKQNVSEYFNQIQVKKALGNNFLNFIYTYHKAFPDLCSQAEKEFNSLDVGKMWPVGGKKFQRLAKIIGFKNALKLKSIYLF